PDDAQVCIWLASSEYRLLLFRPHCTRFRELNACLILVATVLRTPREALEFIDQYHCFIPPDQEQRENMNLKNKLVVTVAILAVMAVAFAPSAYAQTITTRTDQASYTPGGAGTQYITVLNNR